MNNFEVEFEIPILVILRDAGYVPCRHYSDTYIFRALWGGTVDGAEEACSGELHVSTTLNCWHFWGPEGNNFGGGSLKLLYQLGLVDRITGDPVQYIRETYPDLVGVPRDQIPDPFSGISFPETAESPLSIIKSGDITDTWVKNELRSFWIPLDVASKYCRQATFCSGDGSVNYYYNTGIALQTDGGGCVVRTRNGLSAVGRSGVATISYREGEASDDLILVPGMMDFLALVTMFGDPACDVIILNSSGMAKHAGAEEWGYRRVYAYIGDDQSSRYAKRYLREVLGLRLVDCRGAFDGYRSLAECNRRRHQQFHAIITVAGIGPAIGKTATAFNLASMLAEQGVRTLLVDMDPEGDLSDIVQGGRAACYTAYDAILGTGKKQYVHVRKSLDLLPSDRRLSDIPRLLTGERNPAGRLKRFLEGERASFDLIIIDGPSSRASGYNSSLYAADEVLIMAAAVPGGADQLKDTLRSVETISPVNRPHVLGVVTGRLRKDTKRGAAAAEAIVEASAGETLMTAIRESKAVGRTMKAHQSVLTLTANCNGYKDYNELAFCVLEALSVRKGHWKYDHRQ